jgi:hypothetical protein
MFIGILLLLMGVLLLLDQLNIIYIHGFWSYFWPVALIALGVSMVLKHTRNKP